ncbi:MAG TPA: bifunctional precorrin-2 dehydrogenase/sirohydrochlorin ferrochelatase [Actinomycetes bacterium]|nr:bifunctional precorrin-2 dehydrogenase/sirohydrochlorin ferrochelatase [Actinomycetes bacterium]
MTRPALPAVARRRRRAAADGAVGRGRARPPARGERRATFGYPVSLDLSGRAAVVIGRVAVAQGKAGALLAAGASVTVVADGPAAALDGLARDPRVTVRRRAWRPADLDGAFVCVASSADPVTRAAVYRAGRARGVLVNVMDDVEHCDFAAPAVVRRGRLAIAISTGGRSPALARRLRELLERRFGPEWAQIMELVGQARAETLPALPDYDDRARRWQAALDLEELEALVRQGHGPEAKRLLLERLLRPGPAGPG